jgi:hypothetical protein
MLQYHAIKCYQLLKVGREGDGGGSDDAGGGGGGEPYA